MTTQMQILQLVRDADLVLHRAQRLTSSVKGSGKSTLARSLVRLVRPETGRILFHGTGLRPLGRGAWQPSRRQIQIFPGSVRIPEPARTVGQAIAECPTTHGIPRAQARARARKLLRLVELDPHAAERYPHELSGGQRQRIGLARALAIKPEVLIPDEPVSALDVVVQAQVLDLLGDIRARLGLTMLFITHDLRVAAQICDRVAVMQQGAIVEHEPTHAVFSAPEHPHTRALLSSIPGGLRKRGVSPTEAA